MAAHVSVRSLPISTTLLTVDIVSFVLTLHAIEISTILRFTYKLLYTSAIGKGVRAGERRGWGCLVHLLRNLKLTP
jgi:hypothetical protein